MLNIHSLTPVFDDVEQDDLTVDLALLDWEGEVYDLDPTGGPASRY